MQRETYDSKGQHEEIHDVPFTSDPLFEFLVQGLVAVRMWHNFQRGKRYCVNDGASLF